MRLDSVPRFLNAHSLRSVFGSTLLGALALFAPQAKGSSLIVVIGGGNYHQYGDSPYQPFPADLNVVRGSSDLPYTELATTGTFHIPDLGDSAHPLGEIKIGERGQFTLVDAINGNRFRFQGKAGIMIRPPNPANFPGNRAPVATSLTLPSNGREPLRLLAGTVASDPDGDQLTARVVAKAKWGVLATKDSETTYIPLGAYSDGDTFTIELSDGHGGAAQSTITLVNPLTPFAGSYSGAIGEIGRLNATIDRQGVGTIQIWLKGQRYNAVAGFPISGSAPVTLTSANSQTLSARLDLIAGSTPVLRLTITVDQIPIEVDFPRRPEEEFLADYIGQYNFMLSGLGSNEGYAIANVKPDGSVRLVGYLPNGQPWSFGGQLTQEGKVSVARFTRKGKPHLVGELTLPPVSQGLETVSAGKIEWSRSSRKSQLSVVGGRFEPPSVRGQNIFSESRTKFDFHIESPYVAKITTYYRLASPQMPGKLVSIHADYTRLAVDRLNRVSQTKPGSTLTSIVLQRNGRFRGIYLQGEDSPPLTFHGLFWAPDRATARLNSGAGYVSISR